MGNKISDEIVHILNKSTIEGSLLYLPEKLDRKVYTMVNDLLVRLGGHWSARKKAHEFQVDPNGILRAVLDCGIWPEKNPHAFFPSPKEVVDEVMLRIESDVVGTSPRILEPSAGLGAFAKVLRERFPQSHIDLCELNEVNVSFLKNLGFNVHQGDFLQFSPTEKYDLIVMNPPFSYDGHPNAWAEHIIHAFSMLKEHGVLYAVTPDLSQSKMPKDMEQILSRHIYGFHSFARGAFKESGTSVSTSLISLYKKSMDYDDMDMYLRNERILYDMVINSESINYKALEEKARQIYMSQNTYLRFSFEYLKEAADNMRADI